MTTEELQKEWERQVQKLISLDFHRHIGKSEFTYRKTLPPFFAQPATFTGRFDIPLLVDPRMSLKKLHKMLNIHPSIDEDLIVDTIKPLEEPYTMWTHDANRYRQFSVKEAVKNFQPDEMVALQLEVTTLYLHHPEIFQDHGVDASGSLYGTAGVTCLDIFTGRPTLNIGALDHPDSRWGALSRSKATQFLHALVS